MQSGPLWGRDVASGPWNRRLRNTVTLALSGATTVSELERYARLLARFGVYRLSLLGQAPVWGPGILASYLASPTVAFYLDVPLHESTPELYLFLAGDGDMGWWRRDLDAWGWTSSLQAVPVSGLPSASCMIVPHATVPLSRLYDIGRRLGGPGFEAPFPSALGIAFPGSTSLLIPNEERPVEAAFVDRVVARRGR
jgi:hypothetical protein